MNPESAFKVILYHSIEKKKQERVNSLLRKGLKKYVPGDISIVNGMSSKDVERFHTNILPKVGIYCFTFNMVEFFQGPDPFISKFRDILRMISSYTLNRKGEHEGCGNGEPREQQDLLFRPKIAFIGTNDVQLNSASAITPSEDISKSNSSKLFKYQVINSKLQELFHEFLFPPSTILSSNDFYFYPISVHTEEAFIPNILSSYSYQLPVMCKEIGNYFNRYLQNNLFRLFNEMITHLYSENDFITYTNWQIQFLALFDKYQLRHNYRDLTKEEHLLKVTSFLKSLGLVLWIKEPNTEIDHVTNRTTFHDSFLILHPFTYASKIFTIILNTKYFFQYSHNWTDFQKEEFSRTGIIPKRILENYLMLNWIFPNLPNLNNNLQRTKQIFTQQNLQILEFFGFLSFCPNNFRVTHRSTAADQLQNINIADSLESIPPDQLDRQQQLGQEQEDRVENTPRARQEDQEEMEFQDNPMHQRSPRRSQQQQQGQQGQQALPQQIRPPVIRIKTFIAPRRPVTTQDDQLYYYFLPFIPKSTEMSISSSSSSRPLTLNSKHSSFSFLLLPKEKFHVPMKLKYEFPEMKEMSIIPNYFFQRLVASLVSYDSRFSKSIATIALNLKGRNDTNNNEELIQEDYSKTKIIYFTNFNISSTSFQFLYHPFGVSSSSTSKSKYCSQIHIYYDKKYSIIHIEMDDSFPNNFHFFHFFIEFIQSTVLNEFYSSAYQLIPLLEYIVQEEQPSSELSNYYHQKKYLLNYHKLFELLKTISFQQPQQSSASSSLSSAMCTPSTILIEETKRRIWSYSSFPFLSNYFSINPNCRHISWRELIRLYWQVSTADQVASVKQENEQIFNHSNEKKIRERLDQFLRIHSHSSSSSFFFPETNNPEENNNHHKEQQEMFLYLQFLYSKYFTFYSFEKKNSFIGVFQTKCDRNHPDQSSSRSFSFFKFRKNCISLMKQNYSSEFSYLNRFYSQKKHFFTQFIRPKSLFLPPTPNEEANPLRDSKRRILHSPEEWKEWISGLFSTQNILLSYDEKDLAFLLNPSQDTNNNNINNQEEKQREMIERMEGILIEWIIIILSMKFFWNEFSCLTMKSFHFMLFLSRLSLPKEKIHYFHELFPFINHSNSNIMKQMIHRMNQFFSTEQLNDDFLPLIQEFFQEQWTKHQTNSNNISLHSLREQQGRHRGRHRSHRACVASATSSSVFPGEKKIRQFFHNLTMIEIISQLSHLLSITGHHHHYHSLSSSSFPSSKDDDELAGSGLCGGSCLLTIVIDRQIQREYRRSASSKMNFFYGNLPLPEQQAEQQQQQQRIPRLAVESNDNEEAEDNQDDEEEEDEEDGDFSPRRMPAGQPRPEQFLLEMTLAEHYIERVIDLETVLLESSRETSDGTPSPLLSPALLRSTSFSLPIPLCFLFPTPIEGEKVEEWMIRYQSLLSYFFLVVQMVVLYQLMAFSWKDCLLWCFECLAILGSFLSWLLGMIARLKG